MTLVLGFGSTEEKFERDEEEAIKDFAVAAYRHSGVDYVSEDLVKKVSAYCDERTASFRRKADEYKTSAEFPGRYSYYFARVVSGASDLIVIAKFLHINRRHAMSSDGWAMITTERLIHVSTTDL